MKAQREYIGDLEHQVLAVQWFELIARQHRPSARLSAPTRASVGGSCGSRPAMRASAVGTVKAGSTLRHRGLH